MLWMQDCNSLLVVWKMGLWILVGRFNPPKNGFNQPTIPNIGGNNKCIKPRNRLAFLVRIPSMHKKCVSATESNAHCKWETVILGLIATCWQATCFLERLPLTFLNYSFLVSKSHCWRWVKFPPTRVPSEDFHRTMGGVPDRAKSQPWWHFAEHP